MPRGEPNKGYQGTAYDINAGPPTAIDNMSGYQQAMEERDKLNPGGLPWSSVPGTGEQTKADAALMEDAISAYWPYFDEPQSQALEAMRTSGARAKAISGSDFSTQQDEADALGYLDQLRGFTGQYGLDDYQGGYSASPSSTGERGLVSGWRDRMANAMNSYAQGEVNSGNTVPAGMQAWQNSAKLNQALPQSEFGNTWGKNPLAYKPGDVYSTPGNVADYTSNPFTEPASTAWNKGDTSVNNSMEFGQQSALNKQERMSAAKNKARSMSGRTMFSGNPIGI